MMKKNNRRVVLAVVLILVVCAATIGGTIAWLKVETAPVVNVFTTSDISITLKETEANFKMVPGNDIAKDPVVTVVGGSEACWLFVKVEKENAFDSYMTYAMADGWTELTGVEGVSGVYYCEVEANAADQKFAVLADNKVTVKTDVTKDMMDTAKTAQPTMKFTAYAIQKANIADEVAAWTALNT